jgi:hypothetical protein
LLKLRRRKKCKTRMCWNARGQETRNGQYRKKWGQDKCWVVLTGRLKTGAGFHTRSQWVPASENHHENRIEGSHLASNMRTGPVLMVIYIYILELSGKSCPVGPELHPPFDASSPLGCCPQSHEI